MKIYSSIEEYHPLDKPLFLTIGNFDGVHLGHLSILEEVKKIAAKEGCETGVITFANHPSSILRPQNPASLLCTLDHRLLLIEKSGVDNLFLLNFTQEFANQSAAEFLNRVHQSIPFHQLILGPDSTLGKGREGDRLHVQTLAKKLNFKVQYLPEFTIEGKRVSSSLLRELILQGRFAETTKFLGRKYSIYSSVVEGIGKGRTLGFPTANIAVRGLCLPPLGVYAARVNFRGSSWKAIANLGVAPTIRNNSFPLLEVHLLDEQPNLYGQRIEVVFYQYIRPEQKFASINELKKQIELDIELSKKIII